MLEKRSTKVSSLGNRIDSAYSRISLPSSKYGTDFSLRHLRMCKAKSFVKQLLFCLLSSFKKLFFTNIDGLVLFSVIRR